ATGDSGGRPASGTGGQDEDPADVDFVGVGEGVAVELGLAPVEHVDVPPPERVAQLVFGDVPQVVALDHPVDATRRVLRPPGDAMIAMSGVGVSSLAGEAL